ncbi:hypothetical protein Lal_00004472 [Lupinus albus]|nr:hypothetical protein Lal_00004472 [Lupinus albus]
MCDANESETFNILIIEFLNLLVIFGVLNHKIKLKVRTLIILNFEGKLMVIKMENYELEAKIVSGKNYKHHAYSLVVNVFILISIILWSFTLIIRQFSIIISYAMTINKS